MAKILEMPKLSPTMEEGVLSAWHKKEGDAVVVDDLLAEVETDKATMEFRAFDKGTLLKLLVEPGALVKLGQPVAILGDAGEDVAALVAQAQGKPAAEPPTASAVATSSSAPTSAPAPAPVQAPPAVAAPSSAAPPAPPPRRTTPKSLLDRTEREDRSNETGKSPASDGRVLASPYVRKTARDMGLDLSLAQGSGPRGRIVAKDLGALKDRASTSTVSVGLATRPPSPSGVALTPAGLAAPEVRPLSMMRKTIARRLTEAKQTVPHFYLTVDVDADELVALRERINHELAGAADGPRHENGQGSVPALKISINDLLIKACAAALIRVPECNAQFTPEAILVHRRVDISVAVAVPEGLLTPVVRNADTKSVVAIAREVRELASRARAKKLTPEEMMNGTFSISNLGMFGIDVFSAVINPPEGAILAVGQVRDVPVVRNGELLAGKKLAMTLSCDHRVVDGAVGASFLAELRELVVHPMRVLTG
jgi:pyruvate dehydrogenase E2 component (dihydrolipoamide acetyltransferase)